MPTAAARVGFTGGHFHKNWRDDNFRKVVLNAAVWVCKAEVPEGGRGLGGDGVGHQGEPRSQETAEEVNDRAPR